MTRSYTVIENLSAHDPAPVGLLGSSSESQRAEAMLHRILAAQRDVPVGLAYRQPRRTHRRAKSSIGIAIGAVTVLVVALVVDGVIEPGSLVRPKVAAAAQVLDRAATLAADQPPLPALGPGQYYYQSIVERGLCSAMPSSDTTAKLDYVGVNDHETWVAADGTSSIRIGAAPGGHWLSPQDQAQWQAEGSPPIPCEWPASTSNMGTGVSEAPILALPSNPAVLGSLIAQGRVNDIGQVAPSSTTCPSQAGDAPKIVPTGDVCSVSAQFDIVRNLLDSPVGSQKLAAVLYQILAKLPGVELLGSRSDALGRTGTAIEDPSSGSVVVLEPSTGTLLELETVAVGWDDPPGIALGTVLYSGTFGPVSVVNGSGTTPSGSTS
ncbi:MAG: CU044_5270 family protein [Acidimicrobiales bacterium]